MHYRNGHPLGRLLTMNRLWLNPATGYLLTSIIVTFASCDPIYVQNRILGGSETTIEVVPYQLSLEGGGRQLCGASVLSKDWALTAAHCVKNQPTVWLQFRAGSSKLLSGGTIHPVDYYRIHEKYDKTFTYDVAVVKVRVPFKFNELLQPVLLPSSVPVHMESVWVSGWGYMQKEKVKKPKDLMLIDLYVFRWEDCKILYGKDLSESMMCAGDIDKDTCNGDSGGPLVRPGGEQVGIVSWGYGCGGGLPSVYTNVSVVTDWILKRTKIRDVPKVPNYNEPFIFPSD